MSEHISEPDDGYEEEPSYGWDYQEDKQGPQILWGRVIALGALILLAFLFGRSLGSGGESAEQAGQIQQLRDRVESLQADNEALRAAAAAPESTPTPAAEQTTPPPAAQGKTYTVKKGDTLTAIAERQYGDADLDVCIAEANSISDPTQLSVGQELLIPDKSTC